MNINNQLVDKVEWTASPNPFVFAFESARRPLAAIVTGITIVSAFRPQDMIDALPFSIGLTACGIALLMLVFAKLANKIAYFGVEGKAYVCIVKAFFEEYFVISHILYIVDYQRVRRVDVFYISERLVVLKFAGSSYPESPSYLSNICVPKTIPRKDVSNNLSCGSNVLFRCKSGLFSYIFSVPTMSEPFICDSIVLRKIKIDAITVISAVTKSQLD
jgi:hypothetical protein